MVQEHRFELPLKCVQLRIREFHHRLELFLRLRLRLRLILFAMIKRIRYGTRSRTQP